MTQHEINLRAQAQAGALAPRTMAAIQASARYTSYLIDKADFAEGYRAVQGKLCYPMT